MTSPGPLVSVIVPVYNVERYLDCCLGSIRSQTYEKLEIIVVEDCSTDTSLAQLQPHLADPRLRLIRHEHNAGLSAARNTGIDAATGDYVMFVDSDDCIAQTLVQACVTHVAETGADLVAFDFVTFDDGEALPEIDKSMKGSKVGRLNEAEYFILPHFAWLKFIRADLFHVSGLRFPIGLFYEDWPFHWGLGFVAQSIHLLDVQYYFYRQRVTSISASSGRKLLDQFKAQEIVLQALRERHNRVGMEILSKKIHLSVWSILTRIDTKILPEAISDAKRLHADIKSATTTRPRGCRNAFISSVLSLPLPVAISVTHLIRWLKRGAKALIDRTSFERGQ